VRTKKKRKENKLNKNSALNQQEKGSIAKRKMEILLLQI
jgi:hypothetical protein